VQQGKFIPVVNEYDESDKPFLPNYLASRMYADLTVFCTSNWEGFSMSSWDKRIYRSERICSEIGNFVKTSIKQKHTRYD